MKTIVVVLICIVGLAGCSLQKRSYLAENERCFKIFHEHNTQCIDTSFCSIEGVTYSKKHDTCMILIEERNELSKTYRGYGIINKQRLYLGDCDIKNMNYGDCVEKVKKDFFNL